MSDKKITLDADAIFGYFKNLSTDMLIAYCVILLGVILIVLSFFL